MLVPAEEAQPSKAGLARLEFPRAHRGVDQYPLSGISMRYSFDAKPEAPTKKTRQYYAMLGTRGLWENGWKAVAVHAPLSGKGNFDKDVWQLYHVDVDRAESRDLAKENHEKLQALIKAWFEEAEKNNVLPLDDRSATELLTTERPVSESPPETDIYYSGTSPVPEGVAVNTRGRSFKILADVEIKDSKCSGVIFAHGSRFGGHALFIKDQKLYYVNNFLDQTRTEIHLWKTEDRQIHSWRRVHQRLGWKIP
jgi:arylsulfatase